MCATQSEAFLDESALSRILHTIMEPIQESKKVKVILTGFEVNRPLPSPQFFLYDNSDLEIHLLRMDKLHSPLVHT